MPAGIFGLKKTYKKQVLDSWPELAEFGYFAGGWTPPTRSTIDRLDFSNETVGRSTNLTQAKNNLAAVSNSNYGYFGGGGPGPNRTSNIDRLDFSNETVLLLGNKLIQAKTESAGVSSPEYGYFGGGYVLPSAVQKTLIERFDFSNETVSAPGNNLPQELYDRGAVSSPEYGYFAGGLGPGFSPPRVCTIDRLDFSNETVSTPGNDLTQARSSLAAVSNSNYGYFAGGRNPVNPPSPYCTIDRLDFSNETVGRSTNLTQARWGLEAVSNSNYGYFGGGSAPFTTCNISRFDFSTETTSNSPANLTQARYDLAAVSTKPTTETVRKVRRGEFDASGLVYSNYGYFGGGYFNPPPTRACTIDRLDFSNETTSAPGNDLTQRRNSLAAVSNSNYSYFGGGFGPLGSFSIIERLDFSNETVLAPGNNLTQARNSLAAVSNSNYGYFGGGNATPSPNLVCTIDRLDFATETVLNPNPGAYQLTRARKGLAVVSNSNYGYFAGGEDVPGSEVCTIDRLDFSNETVDVPGTLQQLTQARFGLAAVSNSNYGYFGGGYTSPPFTYFCTIDRLDFSSETVSAPGNNLTEARSGLAGVSNSNYGYFGGGGQIPATYHSTIDRLDFATETVEAPGAYQLTEARGYFAGTNIPLNQTRHAAPQEYYTAYYGYFAGGLPFTDAIVRFDLNTELNSTIPTVSTKRRRGAAAVSSPQYGYFGGGYFFPPATNFSTIERLDFSNETIESPGSYTLSTAQYWLGAVSTPEYGYFGAGYAPTGNNYCAIDRLDFSTETVAGPPVHGIFLSASRQSTVSTPDYGYFTGSVFNTPLKSDFDRLDFSTETVTGPPVHGLFLTQAREASSGVFNSNYGYFAGGDDGTTAKVCTIDRLDFSTETILNPAASLDQLTQTRGNLAAVQSLEYGYFAGGQNIPTTATSVIDRLEFSSETVSLNGSLPFPRSSMAGVSMKLKLAKPFTWKTNKNTLSYGFGYFGGGNPITVTINRLDFSNETVTGPPIHGINLTQARYSLAAVSNSNYGYFAGGNTSTPTIVCTIDRLDFSNETVSAPGISPGQLTQAREKLAGVSNSNYGYFAGGTTPPQVCTIDRLDFSNETVSAPGNNLTQARRELAAVSNSNYGYFGGGFDLLSTCLIDRLDFSNETTSAPGNNLTQRKTNLTAVSNSNYGYFAGSPSPSDITIDRLDFSSETTSNPPANLTQARGGLAAVSSSNYGYFGGGSFSATIVCTIDRLDFSNETVSAPGNNLTQARNQLAGVQVNYYQKVGIPISKAYGYFGRGRASANVCTIDRLDFSNETTSAPGNNLTQARHNLAAVSNSNYGYFGGGYTPGSIFYSTIDRLDFSNETTSNPPANLLQARLGLAAVSNSNYGYFGGGFAPPFGSSNTIDRLDFSNETVSVPGNGLTERRYGLAATFNSNYGYFAGGLGPFYVCTIDRLDFSNETVTGPPIHGINLAQAKHRLAATSNSNYGYFGGGYAAGVTEICTIDRLEFSNETVSAPGTYQLTQARDRLAAVSNSNYGYFAGGYNASEAPPYVSTIDRLDFSNETVSAPGNNLTQARYNSAAVSN